MLMTMKEMKKAIQVSFKKQYGFAPTQKQIIPLEGSGYGNKWTAFAFWVNGIGYSYKAGGEVERAEVYDMDR